MVNVQNTIDTELVKALFEAEVHLGHKKNRLHPKAKRYVYRIENGTSIIDLTITAKQLKAAKAFLIKSKEENKKLMVVATKKVAVQMIADLCKEHDIAFITTKWLPGLLTNFPTLIKNVKKMNEMRTQKAEGEWEKMVKHERIKLQKTLSRLEKLYSGLHMVTTKPDVLFVIDTRREHNAVREAFLTNTPVVGITDTNTDPQEVTYPIVANDDSPKAVEYVISEVLSAYTRPAAKPEGTKKEKKDK